MSQREGSCGEKHASARCTDTAAAFNKPFALPLLFPRLETHRTCRQAGRGGGIVGRAGDRRQRRAGERQQQQRRQLLSLRHSAGQMTGCSPHCACPSPQPPTDGVAAPASADLPRQPLPAVTHGALVWSLDAVGEVWVAAGVSLAYADQRPRKRRAVTAGPRCDEGGFLHAPQLPSSRSTNRQLMRSFRSFVARRATAWATAWAWPQLARP